MARRQRLTSLRLDEFGDRELLALMVDLRDASGVVTTAQIAEALEPDSPHPTNCVGIRLGWMTRYKVVEHAPNGTPGWRLTKAGEAVAAGQLTTEQAKVLDTLDPAQGLDAALALGRFYRRIGVVESTMLRRGWQHASGRRG